MEEECRWQAASAETERNRRSGTKKTQEASSKSRQKKQEARRKKKSSESNGRHYQERFEKKRFRQSETTFSFPKIGLKFPENLKCFFDDDL